MQTIYEFLKYHLKLKNVRVDDIVTQSGISRTTVYRMMKGLLKPTPQMQNLFVEILELDEREEYELEQLIKLIDVDENQLLARKELHKIIYNTNSNIPKKEELEFVVYEKEKYIKKYDEILNIITQDMQKDSFEIEMKILNCISEQYLKPVVNLFTKIKSNKGNSIEHLLTFSETNNYKNVLILKSILLLSTYSFYDVFFEVQEYDNKNKSIFENMIIIKYSFTENNIDEKKYMVLSFEENNLSDCYITNEKRFYEMFQKKYKLVKENHKNFLNRENNVDFLNDSILAFESGGKHYAIKANPCYNRIPMYIYEDLLGRQDSMQFNKMISHFGENLDNTYNIDIAKESVFKNLTSRSELSKKYIQIDVYSKEGMEKLAKELKISDHYDFLPEFTKEEVKAILENIRNKKNDKKDKFTFYITNSNLSDNNKIYLVSENNGVCLDYFEPDADNGLASMSYINQDTLTNSFMDFVEKYVPDNLAMSDADADAFIDYLILNYC